MISHQYRCIFIHQRKTAGCSIIYSFGINPDCPEWHTVNDGILSPNWRDIRSKYPDYFVFAVIRNPWDRFVSGWKYLKSTRNINIYDLLTNLPTNEIDYSHLTRPQSDTLLDNNGNLVTDFLIRFENLQKDYDNVCDIIDKPRCVLKKHNATNHEHYSHYFDDKSLKLFKDHFKKDIELFEYEY